MKSSIVSTTAKAVVAAAALGAAGMAAAQYQRHYYDPPRVYEPGRTMHGPPVYAYGEDHDHDRAWREGCRAARWDPNQRYFPGQAVQRKGHVYVARGISSRVYNVNSPPEWTPNYWAPARC